MNTARRQALSLAAWWRQRQRCIWCGAKTWHRAVMTKDSARAFFGIKKNMPGSAKHLRRRKATAEHLIPKSLGGAGGANIVSACAHCNHSRGNDPWAMTPHPEVLSLIPKASQKILDGTAQSLRTGAAE